MPLIADPRYTQSAIAGDVRSDLFATPPEPEESPPLLDTLAAASRQATLPGAGYERLIGSPNPDGPDAPPGWDALNNIAGFENYADRFIDADSPAEVAGIKSRIGQQERDRDVLRRAGLGGPVAEIGLNLLDPSFLAAAAVPELAFAKAARMSKIVTAAVRGAAGAGAYETGMQAVQEGRTVGDSAINIGAGALLGGLLGTLGRRVPRAESNALRDAVRADLAGEVRSEVGAGRVGVSTTLAQETIATGGRTLEAAVGHVPLARTDLQVVLHSESVEARRLLQEIADVGPVLEKNVEGIASPVSVELLVGRHEGRVADFVSLLHDAWRLYRGRVPAGERLKRSDFYAQVSGAARRGDESAVPEIADASKFLRARVFDPLKVEAQQLGLLPADVEVVGAESYFRRMYDREAIRADRREWDSLLTRHFMRRGDIEYAEARSIAEDITRRILGGDVGVANFHLRTHVPDAGPLHDRVLDIPDELLERYLVNDPVKVATAYVRELAPQVEMVKRFGDKELKGALQHVKDEYDVLRERIRGGLPREPSSPELTRLADGEKRTLEALVRVRDRVYGRAGRIGPDASTGERLAVQALRNWRNLTASGRMGTTALTSWLTDTANITARYGFLPTIGKIAKLATSPAYRSLSTAQARQLGAAVEVTMARRVNVAFDGAYTEGWSQALAQGVYKYTGLNHVTDFGRTLSVTLLEDHVLKVAAAAARGELPTGWARTRLAALGLDDEALRGIAAATAKHGGDVDGVRVSGSSHWDDAELAARYETALLKESRRTVMEPGAASRTWWMDTEVGRVLGQLKSFALAAPMRMTMVPAQLIGQRQPLLAARFIGFMMMGGALAHILRATSAGFAFETDPQKLAGEAFTEAGLGGVLPDLVAPFARRFGLLGESARYSDRNIGSAFGGPAAGLAFDVYDLAMNRTANGMSAADLHMLRRLLPGQNVWFLRRAINALEGESAEAMGLAGAEARTFGERFAETRELLPAEERGGTGTGVVY
jgi:hypothetical protein